MMMDQTVTTMKPLMKHHMDAILMQNALVKEPALSGDGAKAMPTAL
jgi:hypothetical protein